MAEFDNYRKRTLKEKGDLIRNGGEKVLADLLPVIDDFERAIDAIDKTSDIDSLKEGVNLIYNKFVKYLEKQQVKPMESTGKDFDSDIHEAVTTFPAQDESQKGKVIDTVLKGYTINDKVLRHAKVVVGQ
jgi:molecular chaperone GrpE